MTSTSVEVPTRTQRLLVTVRESPSLRSASGFGETFRNLDSLLFVSALQVELERLSSETPERESIFVDSPLEAFWDVSPEELRSANAISHAQGLLSEIRLERVSYNSPLEILLSLVQNPSGLTGALFSATTGGAGVLLVVNRAIKYWEKISDARIKHSKANLAAVEVRKAEADARAADGDAEIKAYTKRLQEAEARMKEADAVLRESEVNLELAAHEAIRSNPEFVRTIYEARLSPQLETPNPAGSLLQLLDRAAQSIASIEDMKLIEE